MDARTKHGAFRGENSRRFSWQIWHGQICPRLPAPGRREAAPAQTAAVRLESAVSCPTPLAVALRLSATKPMNRPLDGPSDGFGRPCRRVRARTHRRCQRCVKSRTLPRFPEAEPGPDHTLAPAQTVQSNLSTFLISHGKYNTINQLPHVARVQPPLFHTPRNRSITATSSALIPVSDSACPDIPTSRNSAPGQPRVKAQAAAGGQIMS